MADITNSEHFQPNDDLTNILEFEQLLNAVQAAKEAGDSEAEQSLMADIMVFASEQAAISGDPSLLWMGHGHQLASAGRWVDAEAAYRQALDFAGKDAGRRFQPLRHLADLLYAVGRNGEARETSALQTTAARSIPSPFPLAMALQAGARFARKAGDPSAAIAAMTETLALFPTTELYALMRARSLAIRAHAFLDMHDLEAASTDLTDAEPLLEAQSATAISAGVHSAWAGWYAATGRSLAVRGDTAGAVDSNREAVARRRLVAAMPHVEGAMMQLSLAESLRMLGESLRSGGNAAEAEDAFLEARTIREALNLSA